MYEQLDIANCSLEISSSLRGTSHIFPFSFFCFFLLRLPTTSPIPSFKNKQIHSTLYNAITNPKHHTIHKKVENQVKSKENQRKEVCMRTFLRFLISS